MLARVSYTGQGLVYLARHGQTAYNHEGRFQGQMQVPLDATGLEQAAELAERAAAHAFRALWCSPLLRARETADIVAARIGLQPVEDARLMETDAGDWTDRSFAEIHAHAPERFAAFVAGDSAFAFPGGSPSPSGRCAGARRARAGKRASSPRSWSATGWSSARPPRAARSSR